MNKASFSMSKPAEIPEEEKNERFDEINDLKNYSCLDDSDNLFRFSRRSSTQRIFY